MMRSAKSLCVATFRSDPPIRTASCSFSRCTDRFQMQKKNLQKETINKLFHNNAVKHRQDGSEVRAQ
jgi:hypothetical protein